MSADNNHKLPSVGISIEGSLIRSVEISADNDSPKILSVNEVKASSNLWEEIRADSGNSDQLLSYLDPVINALPEKPKSLAVAIDSKSAVIKVHLVDTGLPEEEKDEFIQWEARKRLGDSYGEYTVASYPLLEEMPKFNKYLSVSVKNNTIELLESISESLNISLDVIDVDIFAGVNAVLFLNEQASSGKVSIMRYLDGEYTVTMLNNGEFINSSLFYKEKDGSSFIFNSAVKDKNTDDIITSLSSDNLSNPLQTSDNIYIYQSTAQGSLLKALIEKGNDDRIMEVNPFNGIELSDDVNKALLENNPDRFTEAFGMAVRSLESENSS